jgi:hypothetical protein
VLLGVPDQISQCSTLHLFSVLEEAAIFGCILFVSKKTDSCKPGQLSTFKLSTFSILLLLAKAEALSYQLNLLAASE